MSETIRHGLALLASGQAQKEVSHNEAILAIDRQMHLSISSRVLAVAPSTPVPGDAYIVPSGAGGAWASAADAIASYDGFGWILTAPVIGCVAWIVDEAGFVVFDGGWSDGWPVSGLVIAGRKILAGSPVGVALEIGGSIVDIEARAAITQIIDSLRTQGIAL
ncbi:hypothetical protein GCM10011529_01200 [Polymorphobacter glacialis]|uniref:DUF2793 domain-containing protein n=1 Tax=Sandarakinorhabdus glacialis TaxID=1614636 RepID=A0A916ZHY1_9SPHN|nr:DUF2793 domain-containing protein [Polymorphobacter glacialis]GGD98829.1 hypothetical protein GCM10011529_01200 [Polymorphobacter glacialis]